MGYVESGKTANFCALIAKAADVGYKLVIVLSGIHNSLRLQTQHRADRALGLDPSGVPEPEAGRRWIGLTTADLYGDFRPGTIDANVLQGNEHVLMVVKKNATVLRRLTRWMEHRAPTSLPVLIIDDEADQASINTGGNRPSLDEETDLGPEDVDDLEAEDELDPSVINRLVRTLVRKNPFRIFKRLICRKRIQELVKMTDTGLVKPSKPHHNHSPSQYRLNRSVILNCRQNACTASSIQSSILS